MKNLDVNEDPDLSGGSSESLRPATEAVDGVSGLPPDRKTPMGKFRNSVGFQFMFVLHSGLDVDRAIEHICNAAQGLIVANWQPIETAPVNESVLVYIPNAEHYGEGVYRAIWIESDWLVDGKKPRHWQTTGWHHGRDITSAPPTHWMPLPAPPNTQRDSDFNELARNFAPELEGT